MTGEDVISAYIRQIRQAHVERVNNGILEHGANAVRDGKCGKIELVEFSHLPNYTQVYVCRKSANHEPPCNVPSEGGELVVPDINTPDGTMYQWGSDAGPN